MVLGQVSTRRGARQAGRSFIRSRQLLRIQWTSLSSFKPKPTSSEATEAASCRIRSRPLWLSRRSVPRSE